MRTKDKYSLNIKTFLSKKKLNENNRLNQLKIIVKKFKCYKIPFEHE